MSTADRWWWVTLALGAALIVRAPSWGWAILVFVLWVIALAQPWDHAIAWNQRRKLRAEYERKQSSPWQPTPITETQLARLIRTGSSTERVSAADPISLSEMERLADGPPTINMQKIAEDSALGEVRPSGRVIVNLTGTIWTTESLLDEIQAAIASAKDRGDTV